MSTPEQAFERARRAQLERYGRLTAKTRDDIVAALELAQREIAAALLASPSEWRQAQLQRLQPQIAASLDRFRQRGTGLWVDGVDAAWAAGRDLVDQPLQAAGVLARGQLQGIDDRTLLGMRTFLTRKMKGITDEARQRINDQLSLALTGVQSNSQTIDAIDRILGGNARRRAITVTRTELGRAHAAATWLRLRQAAERVPGLQKQWRRSTKLHSRPEHDAADGQVRDIDEPFNCGGVQLMYPRDPTAPPAATINCGCTLLPHKASWKTVTPGKLPFSLAEIAADPRRRDTNQAIAEERAAARLPSDVPGIIPGAAEQAASAARDAAAAAQAVASTTQAVDQAAAAAQSAAQAAVTSASQVADALAALRPEVRPAYAGVADPAELARIERSIAHSPMELGYVIGRSGRALDVIRGERDRLSLAHLRPAQTAGLLFTHNHPRGGALSTEDFFTALAYEFAEFRAVSASRIYRLFPRGGLAVALLIDEDVMPRMRIELREFYLHLRRSALTREQQAVVFSEQAAVFIAAALGLQYETYDR